MKITALFLSLQLVATSPMMLTSITSEKTLTAATIHYSVSYKSNIYHSLAYVSLSLESYKKLYF